MSAFGLGKIYNWFLSRRFFVELFLYCCIKITHIYCSPHIPVRCTQSPTSCARCQYTSACKMWGILEVTKLIKSTKQRRERYTVKQWGMEPPSHLSSTRFMQKRKGRRNEDKDSWERSFLSIQGWCYISYEDILIPNGNKMNEPFI